MYWRSTISSVDLVRIHFRFSAFKPTDHYVCTGMYIITIWNQIAFGKN